MKFDSCFIRWRVCTVKKNLSKIFIRASQYFSRNRFEHQFWRFCHRRVCFAYFSIVLEPTIRSAGLVKKILIFGQIPWFVFPLEKNPYQTMNSFITWIPSTRTAYTRTNKPHLIGTNYCFFVRINVQIFALFAQYEYICFHLILLHELNYTPLRPIPRWPHPVLFMY